MFLTSNCITLQEFAKQQTNHHLLAVILWSFQRQSVQLLNFFKFLSSAIFNAIFLIIWQIFEQ